ncbi:MAG: DUF4430 domain-containing protein [Actinobacteria bacterium]|nr:DUF4430 domain-containing protein [Actinomycetota bacterium]
MLHRTLVPVGAAALALALATPALAVRVHVRVEGAKVNLFGATEPGLTPATGTITPPSGPAVTVSAETAFGALEAASRKGELFYRVEAFSFGPYVAQVGRLSGTATTGWVYKVNGVSPPVAATAYVLKAGDRVLWYHATFGPTGGPKSLRLLPEYVVGCPGGSGSCSTPRLTCARAVLEDDAGRRTRATGVVFRLDGRRARGSGTKICPRGHWHTLSATVAGAVRSQVLVTPRRGSASGSGGVALVGRA